MSSILITGANGMVGRALIKLLLADSTKVKALVFNGEPLPLLDSPELEIIEGDINNIDWVPLLDGIEVVVHLAAKVHVFDKREAVWDDFYRTNVEATKKLCFQAAKAGIKKFVFVSTVGVYGDYPQLNELGELIISPQTDYARSKLMAEAEVVYELSGRVPYLIFRPVMMYGSGDRGNMDKMIGAIQHRRFVIPGSGRNKKTALYVDDFARIVLKSIKDNSLCNETFIVSNKNIVSMREMCNIISRQVANGWKVPSIPQGILSVAGRIGDWVRFWPIDSTIVRKLTIDSDYSEYSVIQKRLGIYEETTLAEALIEMGFDQPKR